MSSYMSPPRELFQEVANSDKKISRMQFSNASPDYASS
jgi:hypothetical protein